jgi:hypothetical protein
MNVESSFHISVGDDPDHEDLTAEIYYKGVYLALISQEQGLNRALIELQSSPDGEVWTLDLAEFVDVLNQAKRRLWDMRRM